jgi:hypothetical protein
MRFFMGRRPALSPLPRLNHRLFALLPAGSARGISVGNAFDEACPAWVEIAGRV